MLSCRVAIPRRAGGAVRGEVSARLPATAATTESAGKVFSTRAGVSSAPRERAGSAAPGPSVRRWERGARRRRNWTWRRRAPQLSAGTPRPTPVTPPPRPRLSPFLPRLLRGAGCTLRAGALRSETFLRACVRSPASPGPRRPYLPPRGPGLHAEGAGGGRRREEASRARRRGPSPERSPLQLQPWSTPSFPPRERGDGGGSRERKSRFPSATRRSSTARHEPEETAAAARRPMGQ